ncbi:GHMP kinase [Flammula alnicola]|nr:GHMP kinase [Flammula alnicola]
MGSRSLTIRVPATSANIGPGFDVVGLSLSLHLTLTISYPLSPPTSDYVQPAITYSGEGSDEVPLNAYKNLTTRVALYVLRCHNIRRFPSHLVIHVDNEIPFGRGLGSSGAAVIAGVLLGDAIGQLHLPTERSWISHSWSNAIRTTSQQPSWRLRGLVPQGADEAATEAASVPLSEVLPEYPPDAGEDWGLDPPVPPFGIGHYVRFGWSESIKAVAIIPRFELSTAKAREVLPTQYSRKDLVFNLQRLAVLTTALGQSPPDPGLIYEAMKTASTNLTENLWHIPGLPEVTTTITPASHPGLLGICLSGAGPTILALATGGFEGIAEDAREIFQGFGISIDWKVLEIASGSAVKEN